MASQGQFIDDLIYDVFRQFIAIDVDGPFTLIQLSTKWRDAILANPHMWTWLTIDHSIPDLEQRIQIASHLSAGFPLQITIKIPSLQLSELQSLLPRCRFLFIDRNKWCGWELEYYTQEIEASAQEISQMLLNSPPPILRQIHWSIEGVGTPFHSHPLHDFLARNKVVDLQALFGAFPTEMISYLRLDDTPIFQPRKKRVYIPSTTTHLLWEALAHLNHLTSLKITTSSVPQEKRRSIGLLNLPQLRNLTLEFTAKKTVFSSVSQILSNLRAPNIHMVHLLGPATNKATFYAVNVMSRSMQPLHLKLDLQDEPPNYGYYQTYDSAPRSLKSSNRLEHLEIIIHRGRYYEDVGFSIVKRINRMIVAAPRLTFLNLDFRNFGMLFISLLDPISCILEISLPWEDDAYARRKENDLNYAMNMGYLVSPTMQEPSHNDVSGSQQRGEGILREGSHQDDITFVDSVGRATREQVIVRGQGISRQNLRLSKLTLYLGAEQLDVCFGALGIDAIEVGALIIRASREEDFLPVPVRMGPPDPWMEFLQELDIQDVTFTQHAQPLVAGLRKEQCIPLPGLKTLRCPPSVAKHLVENRFVPQLRDLTLSAVRDIQNREDTAWKNLAAVLTTIEFTRSLQLITLGLEFYPEWNSLLQVIELYTKGEMTRQSLQYLKLPGLPHPSILEQLVHALRGKKRIDGSRASRLEEASSSFNRDIRRLGCDYCERSGWVCYEDTEWKFCGRHTPEKLVTITRDTI